MVRQSSKFKVQSSKLTYQPQAVETKWDKIWEEKGVYKPDLNKAARPFYNLMMFPYPSAEGLHAGNMYAFTGADIYGRFTRMKGFNVFEPIGLDGFGIHSENYALKIGKNPMDQAKISEKNFYRQLHQIGNGFDWDHKLETYDPRYYKWTQWVFVLMFKSGLAVRKKSPVNFCPSCKTVLADEQVIGGLCERCSSMVEKRELEQWFFKITEYAERLLNNIKNLNWSEKVKIAQTNWIGKSEGALIEFKIENLEFKIEVFTTRPDTLFGVTFLVLSPEHPLVASLLNSKFPPASRRSGQNSKVDQMREYVGQAKKKTEQERITEEKNKTGVFTDLYAINPATNEKIPVWVADYVLSGYGTGAIMGVPAHDQRDFEFAKKYGLDIRQVIEGDVAKEAYEGKGEIINSDDWNGFKMPRDFGKVLDSLSKKGIGKKEIHYHLRDWLISRQRYWGAPIPMIYCQNCASRGQSWFTTKEAEASKIQNSRQMVGWFPVSEKELPVLLPYIKDYRPVGTGKSPLANHPDFYKTACPNCGGEARRETDVSDTFLDSSWYFFRYISTDFNDRAFDRKRVERWLPVDMYIGGAEHSVLHLLYSRFMTMFFYDLGLIAFEEPYKRFFAHGLLIKEGAKMSKSKGNVVVSDEYIKKYGGDTMRCYLMFIGPFSQGGDFYDTGIEGMNKFLKRIWQLFVNKVQIEEEENDKEVLKQLHKTVKGVTNDLERLSYNTTLAKLMEFYNFISSKQKLGKETVGTMLKLLAPFAPHLTEEVWQRFQSSVFSSQLSGKGQSVVSQSVTDEQKPDNLEAENRPASQRGEQQKTDSWSIHQQSWPSYDPKLLEEDEVTIVVQINGKVRDSLRVPSLRQGSGQVGQANKDEVEEMAKKSEKINRYLEGKKVIKVIYVPGKVINFVVE